MKFGIVGARKYQDRQSVIAPVSTLPRQATIITSSCKGVCTWVKDAADHRRVRERTWKVQLEPSLVVVIVGDMAIPDSTAKRAGFERTPTSPSLG